MYLNNAPLLYNMTPNKDLSGASDSYKGTGGKFFTVQSCSSKQLHSPPDFGADSAVLSIRSVPNNSMVPKRSYGHLNPPAAACKR